MNNEKHQIVKESIMDMLIKYDEHIRSKYALLIEAAENMTKGTPLSPILREKDPEEPLKVYRYLTDPLFHTVVNQLTNYILSNTKENGETKFI